MHMRQTYCTRSVKHHHLTLNYPLSDTNSYMHSFVPSYIPYLIFYWYHVIVLAALAIYMTSMLYS